MTTIDLITEDSQPVRRLGAVIRASRDHPGIMGLYTYPKDATELDLTATQPTLTIDDTRAFSFTASGDRLVVSVCDIVEPPPTGGGGELRSVTRRRITWSFDREAEVGQYANGDWWVVGPVNVTAISPASVSVGGRTLHGSMVNPTPRLGERTGADSAILSPLIYDASLNVGLQLPLTLQPGQSLCSTVSYESPPSAQRTRAMEVLQCVISPPPLEAFRCSWTGSDASEPYRLSTSPDRSKLRSLTRVSRAPHPLELLPLIASPPWGDQHPGWIATHGFAPENSPTYGRDISSLYGEVALTLNMDWPEADKERLLIAFVQRGIDLYGILREGGERNWTPNGGHGSGRKWPILFAGIMLDDMAMIEAATDSTNRFGEDDQTWIITDADVGRNGYTAAWLGRAEWGIRHATEPHQDSPSYLANYRTCCTANAWPGFVLAVRAMGFVDAWGHPALFEYLDRYRTEIWPATGLDEWQRDYEPWVGEMWARHRGAF